MNMEDFKDLKLDGLEEMLKKICFFITDQVAEFTKKNNLPEFVYMNLCSYSAMDSLANFICYQSSIFKKDPIDNLPIILQQIENLIISKQALSLNKESK